MRAGKRLASRPRPRRQSTVVHRSLWISHDLIEGRFKAAQVLTPADISASGVIASGEVAGSGS